MTTSPNHLYRLVIVVGGRGRVFEDQPYPNYEHAQTRVAAAVEQAGTGLQEVELQRGTPVAPCVFDPYRIVPGERGGWSHVRWSTMRRWDRCVVDRIARQAERCRIMPANLIGVDIDVRHRGRQFQSPASRRQLRESTTDREQSVGLLEQR